MTAGPAGQAIRPAASLSPPSNRAASPGESRGAIPGGGGSADDDDEDPTRIACICNHMSMIVLDSLPSKSRRPLEPDRSRPEAPRERFEA